MKVVKDKVPNNSQVVKGIVKLHQSIFQNYKMTLNAAIEIGEMLTDVKTELGHSNWLPWVKKYMPFESRTATNYINVFKYQYEIKSANVSSLRDAYHIIFNAKDYHRTKSREETRRKRRQFADKNSNYKNPKVGNYINQVISGDNCTVMKEMIKHGMKNQYGEIITSPPYSASFHYSKTYDDNKSYETYLKEILKPFKLYPKLLRKGGRVIYVIGNVVKKTSRDDHGDYNHQLVDDLKAAVKKSVPELRFFNQIVWEKSGTGRNPLNKKYGTFCNPKSPLTRLCNEQILIWSNEVFELENVEKTEPDITEKEFNDWSWSVWSVAPYVAPGNPHVCSFAPKLIERLVKFYTYKNDLILDPYAGVSTTAQVCKKLGRRYTTVELNPNYCEYAAEQLKSA